MGETPMPQALLFLEEHQRGGLSFFGGFQAAFELFIVEVVQPAFELAARPPPQANEIKP